MLEKESPQDTCAVAVNVADMFANHVLRRGAGLIACPGLSSHASTAWIG